MTVELVKSKSVPLPPQQTTTKEFHAIIHHPKKEPSDNGDFDNFTTTMSNTSNLSKMGDFIELQCTFLPTGGLHQTWVLVLNPQRKRWNDLQMTTFADELKSSIPKPHNDLKKIDEWKYLSPSSDNGSVTKDRQFGCLYMHQSRNTSTILEEMSSTGR